MFFFVLFLFFSSRFVMSYCLLSTIYCLLSTVYCLPSTAYRLLSTTWRWWFSEELAGISVHDGPQRSALPDDIITEELLVLLPTKNFANFTI